MIWVSSSSGNWRPVCFSAKWCNLAGSPDVSNCDVTDMENPEQQTQDLLWEKGVAGFPSWCLEICFLPKNGLLRKLSLFHKKGSPSLLSSLSLQWHWLDADPSFKNPYSQGDLICTCNALLVSPPWWQPHLLHSKTNNGTSPKLYT
jgi:hypothetical protein